MPDGVLGSTATTTNVSVPGTYTGEAIDTSGDHDWYRVELTAGQTYSFTTGAPQSGTGVDTILTLRDANGNQLAINDDIDYPDNAYSQIRFTATTSGTYYIDVGAYSTGTGGYTLTTGFAEALPIFTNDQISDQLTSGYWGGTTRRWNVAPGGTITVNLTGLTAEGQFLAREALNLWTDVTGINFSEITTSAQITFDDNESGAFAGGATSNGFFTGNSVVNVSTDWLANYGTTLNTYSFQTYIHEIGHAIGLGHAGNYNGSANYPDDALYQNDSWNTTIMSYFSPGENTYFSQQGFTYQYTITPMVADIISTNGGLYASYAGTRTGDTTYGFNNTSGRAVYDASVNANATVAIVDHGGIDTLDYSFTNPSYTQLINLNPEVFGNTRGRVGNLVIARGTVIENAIGGAGVDTIIGNSADNILRGNAGNDTIDGGLGTDTAVFSGNRADYTITNLSDGRVQVSGTDGTDTLTGIERLMFDDMVLGRSGASFGNATQAYAGFGYSEAAGGWSNDTVYPRMAVDMNGDGRADLVGFGGAGVYVALANGSGGFGNAFLAYNSFGASEAGGGWSSNDAYPRTIADVNGDGRADLIGFGSAGVYVALGQGPDPSGTSELSFGNVALVYNGFGASEAAGGWSNDATYPRAVADVNGDGRADLIGFGSAGVYVSLGQSDGSFGVTSLALNGFGASDSGGGWSSVDRFPRQIGDVNGDGRADIVGFGGNGAYVSLGQADGTFGPTMLGIAGFGYAEAGGGWASDDTYPRRVADVNGDGYADIVGFGSGGAYVSLSQGDGTFASPVLAIASYGASDAAGGWTSNDRFVRTIADVDGDGIGDIVGFGGDWTYVSYGGSDFTQVQATSGELQFAAEAAANAANLHNRGIEIEPDLTIPIEQYSGCPCGGAACSHGYDDAVAALQNLGGGDGAMAAGSLGGAFPAALDFLPSHAVDPISADGHALADLMAMGGARGGLVDMEPIMIY
ncbi:VCBS repeat-containing protein [Erythrobacter sp. YJ-T3-07]|uniref:FG-GAP-like repeat-containing protein n=1 Tax=Erythrobacter sp. YJ-T3-07 TaxID=2793063 RepID=UPI0018D4B37D|nr:M10 family metallopeptidase C-terminal domain-containing protein [Erythrobacter sp. YJ-T3-07]MBH1943974.1 VCBS repeat-containing protein [Erythrobacter sp. YJ-T3-07]